MQSPRIRQKYMPSQREDTVVSPEPNPFLFSSQEEYGEYGEKRDASYYGKGEKREVQTEQENIRLPMGGGAQLRGKFDADALMKEELTVTDSWDNKSQHSSPNKKNKDYLFSIVSQNDLKLMKD